MGKWNGKKRFLMLQPRFIVNDNNGDGNFGIIMIIISMVDERKKWKENKPSKDQDNGVGVEIDN